jgi:uncharacterized protein (TIGR03067 family)
MKRIVLVALAVGLLVGADKKGARAKEELKKFQGTWRAVSITWAGCQAPARAVKKVRVTFQGNRMTMKPALTIRVDDRGRVTFKGEDPAGVTAAFSLDPSRDPKRFDLTYTLGKRKVTQKGIYRVKGDRLTFCLGHQRPSRFMSVKDRPGDLYVLKREK